MKQKTLLFALLGGFATLVFSSYKDGPYHAASLNRTGSAGTGTNNCSTGGCHATNSAATTLNVTITEVSSSTPVTAYSGGKTYTVQITGSNASAGLTHFGYQLAAVFADRTGTQAGAFAAGTGSAIRAATGGLQIVEHIAPIAATRSGVYSTTATWVAPQIGSGTVKFFLTLNAVNNNNSTSGDQPNNTSVTFTEATASVSNTSFGADIKVYPNPATTSLNIYQANAANGMWNVNVYNSYGMVVYTQQVDVTTGTLQHTVNTSAFAAGMYQVQLTKDGQQKCIVAIIQ